MRVTHPDRSELLERRKRLLNQAGASREELAERASRGALTGDEYWIWENVRSVEFLLGEDDITGEEEGART